jgi:hypothetical protein
MQPSCQLSKSMGWVCLQGVMTAVHRLVYVLLVFLLGAVCFTILGCAINLWAGPMLSGVGGHKDARAVCVALFMGSADTPC